MEIDDALAQLRRMILDVQVHGHLPYAEDVLELTNAVYDWQANAFTASASAGSCLRLEAFPTLSLLQVSAYSLEYVLALHRLEAVADEEAKSCALECVAMLREVLGRCILDVSRNFRAAHLVGAPA